LSRGEYTQAPQAVYTEEVLAEWTSKGLEISIGLMPLDKEGLLVWVWPNIEEGSDGVFIFIPHSCILFLPGTLMHAGKLRTAETGNRFCFLHLIAGNPSYAPDA
jgi:hypothetical protein